MTNETRKMSGAILLSVPTIIYGGYFLLTVLSGEQDQLNLTDFQKSMFRAGHAHAGVLVMFSLLIQPFVDHATLSKSWKMFVRVAFPIAAILVSLGFFAAAIGDQITKPTGFIAILYVGIALLIVGFLTLGIGLVKKNGSDQQ